MAFECGALGRSGGRSSLQALEEMLSYLESEDTDVSHGAITQGDGWSATTLTISRPDEAPLRQYVQVSVGGENLEFTLEEAREALTEAQLQGRDLMLTTTLSGVTDPVVNDRITAYALDVWQGIPWDETSGFTTS
ncbi:hypothetical protein ACF1B0_21095 [Streptomyces anandii]|uniref:hypothetical protein n=1 Tax=Streptomyces anandii TaxID=285454 RepID=UPI0037006B01